MERCSVVIVHPDDRKAGAWKEWLQAEPGAARAPFSVECFRDALSAARAQISVTPRLVIAGCRSSAESVWETVRLARKALGDVPIALAPEESSECVAVEALRAGVAHYLRPPVTAADLKAALAIACGPPPSDTLRLKGASAAIRDVGASISKFAPTEVNVLITGESGTGKELVAELLHKSSLRAKQRFVVINCAAIPDSLVESELFGYEKGSFTGAHTGGQGKLKAADGGTVLLDEIGDMSLPAQAKILRMIEKHEIQPLGSAVCHRINVRILAATNQELSSLSDQGRFRRDLYYRLNVARIHLPPLRERAADIASLARDCVDRITARTGRRLEGIAPEALEVLSGYPWPGNVRELRNVLETAIMTTWNSWLQVEDLPHPLREIAGREATPDERQCLLAALNACNWNKSRAAENLKWSRMTLYRKLARYQLSPKDGSSS